MNNGLSRRAALRHGLGISASLALPGFLSAQTAGTTVNSLTVLPLNNDEVLISGAGANILAVKNSSSVLVVDGGLAEFSEAVLSALAEWSGNLPIEILFNTNWRPEHTGLNLPLGTANTRILAHENTKLWMTIPFDVEWENRSYQPRPAAALPNETSYTSSSLQFGNETVTYLYLPQAHTDGDICVHFPERNLLIVSDLLTVGSYPIVDYVTGGWIGGMEQALTQLIPLTDSDTRIIPAIGPVQTKADLQRQLELCTHVREAVREAYRTGRSLEEFIAAQPTLDYDRDRGNPDQFLSLVFKGTWGHARELGAGII